MTLIQTLSTRNNAHLARLFPTRFYSSRGQVHFSRVDSGQKVTPSCRLTIWLTRVKTLWIADPPMVSPPIRRWWVICRHYPRTSPIRIMNFRRFLRVNWKEGNNKDLRSQISSLSNTTQILWLNTKIPNSYRANNILDTNARSTQKKRWVPRQPASKTPDR